MSKFEEIFVKNKEDVENIDKIPGNILSQRKSDFIINKIKNFDDKVLKEFKFKYNWSTKDHTDLYYLWNAVTIECYCLLNNLRYDYALNIRTNNKLIWNHKELSPDMIINKKTRNSKLNNGDVVEFKIRNTLMTHLDFVSIDSKAKLYKTFAEEIWFEKTGKREEKQVVMVIIKSDDLEALIKKYQNMHGKSWLFDVYYWLKREIYGQEKSNVFLRRKLNKHNNMQKVINILAEKYCENGKKYFNNMKEKVEDFLANIQIEAGIEDPLNYDDQLYENLVKNMDKLDSYFSHSLLENSYNAFQTIKQNIVKVEDLILDAYSSYLNLNDNIFIDHMFDRTLNRKKSKSGFGHCAKYLTDFPVHDLVIEKSDDFCKEILPYILKFEEQVNNEIVDKITKLENIKTILETGEETKKLIKEKNELIDEIVSRYRVKCVITMVKLNDEFKEDRQKLEKLNADISVLKNLLQKEAGFINSNVKQLNERANVLKEQIKNVRNNINSTLMKENSNVKINSLSYYEITDSNKVNLGIGMKEGGEEIEIEHLYKEKTYEKVKLMEDKIEFKESKVLENIKNSVNKWSNTLDEYWPQIFENSPYKNDLDKLSNILINNSENMLNDVKKDWIVKYNILKHLFFKQISLISPYSAGSKMSSKSFASKQLDKLNMYVVTTAPPNSNSCGVSFYVTVHNSQPEQECEKGFYIPFKNGTFLRISEGVRNKAEEHKDFERILSTIIGLHVVKKRFEMGESLLFDSFFLRFNRELVKVFEHVNLIMKNVFCDHTLGKIDMKTEFEGVKLKDYRVMMVIKNTIDKYRKFVIDFKSQDFLGNFNVTDPIFGFKVKNIQSYMSLVYCPSYFPKNDGFDGVRILLNFLLKDIEQNEDYLNCPFNDKDMLENNFFMSESFEDNIARMYKTENKYYMTSFMPQMTFYGVLKTFRDGNPGQKSCRIPDKLLTENTSSSSTKEYLFNFDQRIIKKLLNISELKVDLNVLIRETVEKQNIDYLNGEKSKLDKVINTICDKYLIEQKYRDKLVNHIKRQVTRNKSFIMDVKLPESNMNASVLIFNEYKAEKVKEFLVANGIYYENELSVLRLEDIKVSDLILRALTRCWNSKEYSKITVILDTFPKLQRGFNKRLIYGMFNNPVGQLFGNVDQSCIDLLKNSNIDIITKPGAKKNQLLEAMATETMKDEIISYFIVDQKRYGDKYSVHALMFLIFCMHLFGYYTSQEAIYCLEVLSMLFNRATIIPEKIAKKMREVISNNKNSDDLFEKNPRMFEEIKKLLRGLIDKEIEDEISRLYPGVELNLFLEKSVGFVLGVFNVLGSVGSDAIAQSFCSIANFFIKNLNMKGKTQSDDVLYCMGAYFNIPDFDVEFEECVECFQNGISVNNNGIGFKDIYLDIVDDRKVILTLWSILLNCELSNSQTFSPKKTAFSNFIGEILQTLNVKNKNIVPFCKDVTTLGNSMGFSSMTKDISGMLGNVYSLFLTGADNQLITDVMMLGNYLVRYFYRFNVVKDYNTRYNEFHIPVENGGLFYIYPDLIKINGFMGNYLRLLNLAKKDNNLKIFYSNCLNNNTIFMKNKRVVDNISLSSASNVKKLVDDKEEKNYAGSCFKEFRIRKTGNRFVKESLYTHFQSIISEIIYSIINNLKAFKNNVDLDKLAALLTKIGNRKDIPLGESTRKMLDVFVKRFELNDSETEYLSRPLKSFINNVVKELESIFRTPLKFDNLPFLKNVKFLTKYLKENYQEGYLKSNPHIDRRHVVNFVNWKLVNNINPEIKELLGMKEEFYSISKMMSVAEELTRHGFNIKENKDFIDMNLEIFKKEIEYIDNIEINDVSVVKHSKNKELMFKWVEQKEMLGFSTFLYNVGDILNVIMQETLGDIPYHEITVFREKPYLRVDSGFLEEINRVKDLLNRYHMLNDALLDSVDLLKRLLTGEIKFKTFRTLDREVNRVFDNSLHNFGMYENIIATIHEQKTTSTKIRVTDLNNMNSIIDDNIAAGILLKNKKINRVKVNGEWCDREKISRNLTNSKKKDIKMTYNLDWILERKVRSINFFDYEGKKKKHYFVFTENNFLEITPKKKDTKVKIKTSFNDLAVIHEYAYLLSNSLCDKKIYINNNDIHRTKSKRKKHYYPFLIINGALTNTENNVGDANVVIGLKYSMNKKFNKYNSKEIEDSKGRVITTDIFTIGRIGVFDRNLIKMVDCKTFDYFLTKKEVYKQNKIITEDIKLLKMEEKTKITKLKINGLRKEKNNNIRNMVNYLSGTGSEGMNRLREYLRVENSIKLINYIETKQTRLRLFKNIRIIHGWVNIVFDDLEYEKEDNSINKMLDVYSITEIGVPEVEGEEYLKILELIEHILFGDIHFKSRSWERVNKLLFLNRIMKNGDSMFESIKRLSDIINNIPYDNEWIYSTFNFDKIFMDEEETITFVEESSESEEDWDEIENFPKKNIKKGYVLNQYNKTMELNEYLEYVQENPEVLLNDGFLPVSYFKSILKYDMNKFVNGFLIFINNLTDYNNTGFLMMKTIIDFNIKFDKNDPITGEKLNLFEELAIKNVFSSKWIPYIAHRSRESEKSKENLTNLYKLGIMLQDLMMQLEGKLSIDELLIFYMTVNSNFRNCLRGNLNEIQRIHFILVLMESISLGLTNSKLIKKYYFNKIIKFPCLVKFKNNGALFESVLNENELKDIRELWQKNNTELMIAFLNKYDPNLLFKKSSLRRIELKNDNNCDRIHIYTQEEDYDKKMLTILRTSKYRPLVNGVLLKGWEVLVTENDMFYKEL